MSDKSVDMLLKELARQIQENKERSDRIEEKLDAVNEKIAGLHNSSMAWVNEYFTKQTAALNVSIGEVENRIMKKIEDKNRFTTSQWLIVGIASVGWIIDLASRFIH